MNYQKKKQKARELAIKWQQIAAAQDRDYAYFIKWAAIFNRLAKKYGLVKEFRENAII